MRNHRPQHNGRGRFFAAYLASLPPQERQRIELEERKFLSKREAPYSPHVRTVRDFCASMVGVREDA
jgi:hypothetical protein